MKWVKWVLLSPTILLLATNPVEAMLLVGGFIVAALVVEFVLGWNRR